MIFDNSALIMSIRALRRILDRGEQVTAEIAKIQQEISADPARSEAWKQEKLAAAQTEQNNQLRTLGESARPLIDIIQSEVAERHDAPVDYTADSFQDALFAVQVYGNKLPYEIITAITESARGNYATLRALRVLFENYGIPTNKIEEAMNGLSPAVTENYTLTEFQAFATSTLAERNEWKSAGVRNWLETLEKALAIDTSTNPALAELDAFISDPATAPDMRDRARTWRNAYADRLEADESKAIDMTRRRLAAWRAGQPVPDQGV